MKKLTWIVCSLLLSVGALGAEYLPGEVIVKYREDAARTRSVMNALYDFAGVDRVRRYSPVMKGMEKLVLQNGVQVHDAIALLRAKSELVEYAHPNYIVRTMPVQQAKAAAPGSGLPCIPGIDIPGCDPNMCIIPGLPFPPGCSDNGGGPVEKPPLAEKPDEVSPPVADPDLDEAWGIAKIGADQVWDDHRGDQDFLVAVLDTGIDYNHEDLAFNVWRNPDPTNEDIVGYDFVHDDGLPYDDQSHGTHVSGTIGAVGGNGKAISGVAQHVSIMALKFLSSDGSGSLDGAIRAIDYAIEHGAKILSNSWGAEISSSQVPSALAEAFTRAEEAGILVIAAAGNSSNDNDGSKRSYPASFENENIIAVAATDNKDELAEFSSFGKTTTDLAAPGVDVYSTTPGNEYKSYSGTSMATPHVAGAAALLWSRYPEMTQQEVKEALMNSVDKVDSLDSKMVTGGRLNVLNALNSME